MTVLRYGSQQHVSRNTMGKDVQETDILSMHEAYRCIPVLEKLPLQIESIASYDDRVLVGTQQGHLLLYRVRASIGDSVCDVQLLSSNKNFSRRAIVQMQPVTEYQILVCLTDNVIKVHDLAALEFSLVTTVARTKGASMFQLDIQRHTSLTGEPAVTVRLCAVLRRRLQLYYWKHGQFHELCADVPLADVPRAIAWCQHAVCVGLRNEYSLMQLDGKCDELFPSGKSGEPHICRVWPGCLSLLRDQQSIFIGDDASVTQKSTVSWTHQPLTVLYDAPFMVAVCGSCVEVRTAQPRVHIQTLPVTSARLAVQLAPGQIVVASSSYLWLLNGVCGATQIDALLADKQFQLALTLANLSEESEECRKRQHQHIRNLHAFNMFTKKQFKEAMAVFLELKTDPSHVIGLFPELLPREYWTQLEYPDSLPSLAGRDLENGLLALADFLTQVRHNLSKEPVNAPLVSMAIVEGSGTVQSRAQLLQIVDTTLLKCYLQTNSALAASLLRLKGNHCHLAETEAVLRREHKLAELVILYQTRHLHRRALQLLLKYSRRADAPPALSGHRPLVQYLQNLGGEHWSLIEEFAAPLLADNPAEGLEVFTDDSHEVELLPRDKVCEFLRKVAPSLLPDYLEHVVNVWDDTHAMFHNQLVCQLLARVGRTSRDHADYHTHRRQLMRVLTQSRHYIPEQMLVQFPHDDFYEERAVLLGRLGRHEQALTIYVHVLRDQHKALDYCHRHYCAHNSHDNKVYLCLFAQLVTAVNPRLLGVLSSCRNTAAPDLPAALTLLRQHADKIDPLQALSLLPAELSVLEVAHFVTSSVRRVCARRRSVQLCSALQRRRRLFCQLDQLQHQAQHFTVLDSSFCSICKKRFSGQSILARLPSSEIVHYSCQNVSSPDT